MLNEPMDILKAHPIRKTNAQREAFRADVLAYMKSLGYTGAPESCGSGGENLVFGDTEKVKYLITAHYDTPGTIGMPNVCTPCNGLRTSLMFLRNVAFGALVGGISGYLMRLGYFLPGILMLLLVMIMFPLAHRLQLFPANVNNANDNTSGIVTVLEIARTLPEAYRSKVCFVLFDMEERGLIGSAAYRKAHKTATENQIVLNLDCVGDGDHILFLPTKKARKNQELIRQMKRLGGWFGRKQILVVDTGFCSYNSDHKNFPNAVGIGAFNMKGKHYILDKIHTKHDTNLDMTNVNLLRAALITLICGKEQ